MRKYFKILLLVGIILTSCQSEEETELLPVVPKEDRTGVVKLGKQLKNPYSLVNMQEAYNNIQNRQSNARIVNTELEATNLYVRFLPSDTVELKLLYADTTLEYYNYPLDYEVIEEGGTYHDPDIPLDRPTWQYTVVKPDYHFPNIRYEVLEELFLPEEVEEDNPNARTTFSNRFLDELEDESLRMTGTYNS